MRLSLALALAAVLAALVAPSADAADFTGTLQQGALVIGRTAPGTTVALDGRPVRVDGTGRFVLGFSRDAAATATLVEIGSAGDRSETRLDIAPRQWDVQRIDGLPPKQVTPDPTLLARIRAENARIAAVRESDRAAADVFAGFVPPVPADTRVSGVFGSQRILNGEPRSPHSGTDYAAPQGSPVRAVGPGRVSLAEPDLFYTGQTVMIDHGHGVQSVYAHMSRTDVREGEAVTGGQVIGAVGATGRATGPHLHFGMSWFGEKLDPQLVLPVLEQTER